MATKVSSRRSARLRKRHNKHLIKGFTSDHLRAEILHQGKVLRLHSGTVNLISDKVVDDITQWVKTNPTATQSDYNRRVAKELSRFNSDLAYLYQNRGKII